MTHEEETILALNAVREIGKTYAKLIFQKTIMFDLNFDQMSAGIDAAIADTREFFTAGGICKHDVDVACSELHSAIIQEGHRLAVRLPDNGGRIQ